jgi:hypothetical protein
MEDNSGDETPPIQKVDRRHGSLTGKLEFQEFKPPIPAPNARALSQELLDFADGSV